MRCWLCHITLSSHNASNVKESACKRCFPDYSGGVEGDCSQKTPSKPLDKSSTPIRYAKKNIGKKVQVRYY